MHVLPSSACCEALLQVPARWSCRTAAVQHLYRSSNELHQCTGSRSTFKLGLTPRAARRSLHRLLCRVALQAAHPTVKDGSVSVILLAGGVGKRMGASIPKQYLELLGQPIAVYSLLTFLAMPEVGEVVIVCDPSYRSLFKQHLEEAKQSLDKIAWAEPGKERQDSVYNGLQAVGSEAQLVAVHDSARPLVTAAEAAACMCDANQVGAAVLGVPVKPTIKQVNQQCQVEKTLPRANLWEVQTPQVIRPALLQQGFELVRREGLEVTDDVSIIEALGEPVHITLGTYTNIKVTTPDDMAVAEAFLKVWELAVKTAGPEVAQLPVTVLAAEVQGDSLAAPAVL